LPSSTLPSSWFGPASEFLHSLPRTVMASVLPVRPFDFSRALRVLGKECVSRPFPISKPPLLPLPPSRRLGLNSAARTPKEDPALTRNPLRSDPSRKLSHPTAFAASEALLVHLPFGKGVSKTCPASEKFHPQGLATLSAASLALPCLGSLSQDPTLLGFALQSFSPLK